MVAWLCSELGAPTGLELSFWIAVECLFILWANIPERLDTVARRQGHSRGEHLSPSETQGTRRPQGDYASGKGCWSGDCSLSQSREEQKQRGNGNGLQQVLKLEGAAEVQETSGKQPGWNRERVGSQAV